MSQFQRPGAILFLTFAVTAWLGVPGLLGPLAGYAASEPVLVRGKGFRITEKDLAAKVQNLPLHAKEQFGSDEGKEFLLRELVRIEVFAREARSAGIEKDAVFRAKLSQVTNALLAEEYTKRKVLGQVAKPEDAKRYFAEHPLEFKIPERIKAPSIFIAVPKGAAPETWKEKETRANEIRARAARGEDFAQLMEEASDSEDREPDYFARGRLVPEIEEDVFRLKVGEISPVFRIDSGFLIFRLEDRLPETVPSYEEVECKARATVREQKKQKAFEEMEKRLFDKYGVVFTKTAAPDPSQSAGPGNNPEAATLTGKIIQQVIPQDQSTLLGTIIIEGKGGDKTSLDITPQTAFFKKTAQGKEPANFSDLKKEQWVEVAPIGPARQTYPVQVNAGTIVILPAAP